ARRSGIEKRIDPGEPFLLVCLSDDRVGDLLHLSIALAVAVLEHHAKAASGTDALNDKRLDDHQTRFIDIGSGFLRRGDKLVDRLAVAFTVIEIFQHPISCGRTGRLGLGCPVKTRQHHASLYAVDRQDTFGDGFHNIIRPRGCRTWWKLDHADEITLILLRYEAGGR